jgi:FG-GAP-like repeat
MPLGTNLVLNASFENDGFNTSNLISPVSNWSGTPGNSGETSTKDPILGGHAEYLAIGTVGSLGMFSQTITTVPGRTYLFSFTFSSDGASGNQFRAIWNGNAVLTVPSTPPSSTSSYNPGWASFDGSAIYGFAVTATSTSTTISFSGQGNGSSYVGVDDVSVQLMEPSSDFNGDGKGDILFKTAAGVLPIWELNGSQIAAAAYTTINGGIVGTPAGWTVVDDTGDFNGDGRSDFLWQTNAGQVAIWDMNGTQIQSAAYATAGAAIAGAPVGWTVMGAADFDGDGKSDILWQTNTGGAAIWEMSDSQLKAADYTRAGSAIVGAPGRDWHIVGAGDFNGDGDADILWRTDGGALAIWSMNGTQIQSADFTRQGTSPVKAPGPDWHIITTADFDGDGKSDILWQTDSGAVAIWEMNGTQIKAADYIRSGTQQLSAPPGWKLAGASDVTGDGKADLLWQVPGGALAEWTMNGTQVVGAAYLTAGGGIATTPADWTVVQHNFNFI